MERWAATTLRTVGMILIAGVVVVVGLVLVLLSMCAYQGGFGGGKHPDQGAMYLFGAVAVLGIGIAIEAALARGFIRSAAREKVTAIEARAIPLHLSPRSLEATRLVAIAMGAEIGISVASWCGNQIHYWRAMHGLAPHTWSIVVLGPVLLYHIPYAILIYRLLHRPDRLTWAYSLAVPSVMVLQTLFTLSLATYAYIHQPLGLFFIVVPWLLNIVVLALAYRAIQSIGLHPEPSSLFVAALAAFIYLSVIHSLTFVLYRLAWR